jgi:hypothetical protein
MSLVQNQAIGQEGKSFAGTEGRMGKKIGQKKGTSPEGTS